MLKLSEQLEDMLEAADLVLPDLFENQRLMRYSMEIYFNAFDHADVWCPDDGRYEHFDGRPIEHSNKTTTWFTFTVIDRFERDLGVYYQYLVGEAKKAGLIEEAPIFGSMLISTKKVEK